MRMMSLDSPARNGQFILSLAIAVIHFATNVAKSLMTQDRSLCVAIISLSISSIVIFIISIIGFSVANSIEFTPYSIVRLRNGTMSVPKMLSLLLKMFALLIAGGSILSNTLSYFHIDASISPQVAMDTIPLPIMYLLITIDGAIVEEITFRLSIMSAILRAIKHIWASIIISALIFTLYHFSNFNPLSEQYYSVAMFEASYTFLSAISFGYVFVRGGLEAAIILHLLLNLSSLLLS